jgi:hypothetical protein
MCRTGIVDQYEQDQKLSPDERYIWHLRMEGEIKLAVTMNPILAALIHTAQYLVVDYTFKHVNGELDKCEFVVWYAETNERESRMIIVIDELVMVVQSGVTIARLYCNSATREAFGYAFEALFTSIEKATRRQVKFKVFDNMGHLLAVLLDMEAAQVQGLGDAVVRLCMNNPATSGIHETDPDVLVQFFIKLCTVHFERRVHVMITYVQVDLVINCHYTDGLMSWLGHLARILLNISTNFGHCHHLRILLHGMHSAKTIRARS